MADGETIPLRAGGWIRYWERFLPPAEAEHLYATASQSRSDALRFSFGFGGRIVGLALVTRKSPATDDRNDLDVAEFFVLRRHRRAGVGRHAAALLWNRIPGRRVARVSQGNRS